MHLSKEVKEILHSAENIARNNCFEKINLDHLYLALLEKRDSNFAKAFNEYEIGFEVVLKNYEKEFASAREEKDEIEGQLGKNIELNTLLRKATFMAKRLGKEEVSIDNISFQLLLIDSWWLSETLGNFGIQQDEILERFNELSDNCSKLDTYSELDNINKYVKKNEKHLIGREDDMQLLIESLIRKEKPNAILVGNPGVGKTELVYELAKRINKGLVPDELKNKCIYELNLSFAVSNTRYRGEFEEKLTRIFKEVKKVTNVILFIDEIHTIASLGAVEGGMNAANILKPFLSKGEVQVIGATTFDEYVNYFETDKALNRRFQTISISQLSEESTKEVLESLIDSYEKFHNIKVDTSILDKIIYYTKQYMPTRYFPDKAIDILGHSFAKAKQYKKSCVEESDVIKVIEQLCKIKIVKEAKANNLKNELKKNIVGQFSAIQSLVNQISCIEKGLVSDKRPLGIYMFVGPTGVGKTETAKIIAEKFFGSKDRLIKLNMADYMEPHSVAKLIGGVPGYVGYKNQSYLVDEIRNNPNSIILLDEVEKAHKDVLNVFLNIFDEGYLIDSNKRKVDFRNSIIVMTSNLGYSDNKESMNPLNSTKKKSVDDAVTSFFTPEFLNRIDEIIKFKSLDENANLILARKYCDEYLNRINENINIDDNELLRIVSKDEVLQYGARGVEREVKKLILQKINYESFRLS